MTKSALGKITAFICGVILLAACAPVRVLTHTTSTDPVAAPAGLYRLDPDHASLVFNIDHLGFSRFTGRFNDIAATLDFKPEAPETSRLVATIKAASLDTPVEALDKLITGDDMLEVTKFPEIHFESTTLTRTAAAGKLTGKLTLHGVTKPVILGIIFHGGAPNPLTGEPTLGFAADGTLSRASFGLTAWAPAVGDDVRFHIEAEFVLKDKPSASRHQTPESTP